MILYVCIYVVKRECFRVVADVVVAVVFFL